MNRTILIVICDFLLVSLLAFSSVDINRLADEGAPRQIRVDIPTNQMDSGEDLAAVMRLALEGERSQRDLLLGELDAARKAATQRQALLSEREHQIKNFRQELQAKEQESRQLHAEQASLQDQFAAARANLQSLSRQLENSSTKALLSEEKVAAMEAELRRQAEQADALNQQLARLAKSNEMAVAEKGRLATQLQVAEVEKRHAAEQAAAMRKQVQVEREEKAKLAEGVKTLANQSGELAQEIRENRPLAPNTIFSEFVANRVQARFQGTRSGFLGFASNSSEQTATVLVTDGANIFALCHVGDTPLSLWNPGVDWERLAGTLAGRNPAMIPIPSLSFHRTDPRVVFMPVNEAEAKRLGSRIYSLSQDPFKFQDAVLVGAGEDYYGECRFEIDTATPQYVRLDRSVLKGLFGKFNPSRGDLVFSKTGELLGIMVNDTYCLVVREFETSATIRFGNDVRQQHTGTILSHLYASVLRMPLKLQ